MFLPHLVFLAGFLALAALGGWAVLWLMSLFGQGLFRVGSRCVSEPAEGVDTAILLGLGFKMRGPVMEPGPANQDIWEAASQTRGIGVFLVQDAFIKAAMDSGFRLVERTEPDADPMKDVWADDDGRVVRRIHPHTPGQHVNTFAAAQRALDRMQDLGKKRALLFAHDMHLPRAAWVFRRLRKSGHGDLRVDVACVQRPMRLDPESDQKWTRSAFRYSCYEQGARLNELWNYVRYRWSGR